MATTVVDPPSPGSIHTPISNEGLLGTEEISMQAMQTRNRNPSRRSIDAQRRRSRITKGPSGTGRDASSSQSSSSNHVRNTSNTRAMTGREEDTSRVQLHHDHMQSNSVITPVAPPPKERLPPSPPLTPVASQSSLRESSCDIHTPASLPKQSQGRSVRDSVLDADDDMETGDKDMYHQGGETVSNIVRKSNEVERSLSAQPPNNVTTHPFSPQAPGLSKALVETGNTNASPSSYNGYAFPIPTSTLGSQETSSSMPSHPLRGGLSPQPWELIEPPASNNVPGPSQSLDERDQRIRKASSRSIRSAKNLVVKDGKKYRVPHSSYYFGPPPPGTSAYGTEPIGRIGVHHPREIVRIERDYAGGELIQFSPAYPLELEGRITPSQFLETINVINEILVSAHSLRWSFLDNTLAVLTLYISRLFLRSHYTKEMQRLQALIEDLNKQLYNPVGLNILWPKDVAFMFLEIEYY